MSHAPLTAKYRPQLFSELAGQATVKAILARASLEDKIAPAYLFSGTRGVGKTTVARIFAKAINCEKAPTGEPCNECRNCRQITQGAAVDVIEIDGASNRGIEDARRIREDVTYAPMNCRYKVFIIDEAHMLTREAFNALLKTLEEPPRNVTFIMATTEAHKFPATILSRCQHFSFKRLTDAELTAHLQAILDREQTEYELSALQLIARRAAGSVRDSMSLLGQVLSLGRGRVESADIRNLLGLAGQEVFQELLSGIAAQDPVALAGLLRGLLDQGLDLGFFLRELASVWRNLFLLHQAGEQAAPLLNLGSDELAALSEWAGKFDLRHIHACWQLTLEGQRRVLSSLEPALALELLLLNLAYLPKLIDVEQTSAPARSGPAPQQGGGVPRPGGSGGSAGPGGRPAPAPATPRPAPTRAAPAPRPAPAAPHGQPPYPDSASAPQPAPGPAAHPHPVQPRPADAQAPESGHSDRRGQNAPNDPHRPAVPKAVPPAPTVAAATPAPPAAEGVPTLPEPPAGMRTAEGFLAYIKEHAHGAGFPPMRLNVATGVYDDAGQLFRLCCRSRMNFEQISNDKPFYNWLQAAVQRYFGPMARFEIAPPDQKKTATQQERRAEAATHPTVKRLIDEFDAKIIDSKPLSNSPS